MQKLRCSLLSVFPPPPPKTLQNREYVSVLNTCRINLERLLKTANSFREFFFPIKSKPQLFLRLLFLI